MGRVRERNERESETVAFTTARNQTVQQQPFDNDNDDDDPYSVEDKPICHVIRNPNLQNCHHSPLFLAAAPSVKSLVDCAPLSPFIPRRFLLPLYKNLVAHHPSLPTPYQSHRFFKTSRSLST